MVCGIKTYHESKEGLLSVLGFVASYNKTATKYWSTSKQLENYGDELCPAVASCLLEAIVHFKAVNGCSLERIIVYRDEIAQNQFKDLAKIEVEEMLKVLKPLGIELAYISVKSRTSNIEIYAQGFYEDSFKNAVPGIILDNSITNSSEEIQEFYMLT